MAKILLLGHVPPPLSAGLKIEASSYRTWQFLQPLLEDGHTITLCVKPLKEQPDLPAALPDAWKGQLTLIPMHYRQTGWKKQMQSIHDRFEPDCILAVNFDSCLYATRIKTRKPVWMDIYGDQITIMQINLYRYRSNRGLRTTIGYAREILSNGDVYSVCGTNQKHMLVGELAMSGRVNWRTMGYPFVQVVLPGTPPDSILKQPARPRLSQHGIQPEDFVVLWCGGYNAWTDTETLFSGLEMAMTANPRIHYVSIGASTYGAPDNMYNQLLKKIDGSTYRDRFHMLGWLPWDEIGPFYAEADAGVNIDGLHYETIYGTRTRLLEMMAAGMPVVTSEGTELSYLLRDRGAALTFGSGDWRTFGSHLIALASNSELYQATSDAVKHSGQGEFSFYETTSSVRAWVKQPQRAPDRTALPLRDRMLELQHKARAFTRSVIWRASGLD